MSIHRRLPLTALRSFEATARLGSLTRAAAELQVTHAAISHQIRLLEERLGLDVFHRVGRRVVLSDAGHMLLPVLNESFARMIRTLDELMPPAGAVAVTLIAPPVLAARWLLPRVARLRSEHPQLRLRVLPDSVQPAPVERVGAQISIRLGRGRWRGGLAHLLMPLLLEPVCSPAYARSIGLATPADLARATLWNADVEPVAGSDWQAWLRLAGVELEPDNPPRALRDEALALQAAVDGEGVVLADRRLCSADIHEGRLLAPFDQRLVHACSWWLVRPRRGFGAPARLVHDWLVGEAAQEMGGQ